MEHRAFDDGLALLDGHAQLVAQVRGVRGHAVHVTHRARVLALQRAGQGQDDVLAGVELLAEVADADQRADARAQLVAVDGLVQEVVRARFQRADLVFRAGERGEHEDGDGAPGRRALDQMARLVAVHVRHHGVEDDDGRVVARVELDRLAPVAGEHDVVTPAPEVLLQKLQVLLVVIDCEDNVPLDGRRVDCWIGHGTD
jgi:hypothetical protein